MSDDILPALGARVRSLRRACGHTQEGFAAKVGMDRAYYGRVERGEKNVSVVTAARIAEALGVALSSLFEGVPTTGNTRSTGRRGRTTADTG
ncbi:MAG: XRE family transcriptional regulator [Sphingomonas sp.]|uniref:helix-turn-helix domain-containing protein n=1 Tax=Sphingomonas sp. TaxID=28214 RepID=UPI0012095D64|nr:helix-turn-helix transcriptional regulator [Sphingomonas sp.]THD34448.1 MAG: XRE family transcriptional regulator [Sphingomonas sp.]